MNIMSSRGYKMNERIPYTKPLTEEEEERIRWQEDYFEMYRVIREVLSSRRKRRLSLE